MGDQGGDFNGTPVDIDGITYQPGSESGITWSTQYSSEYVGMYAGVGPEFFSNFVLRDIGGKTAGICVTPWDFNLVRWKDTDGNPTDRPSAYERDGFTGCDCSYRTCDSLVGLGFTFDPQEMMNQIGGILVYAGLTNARDTVSQSNTLLDLGYGLGVGTVRTGQLSPAQISQYRTQIANLEGVVLGSRESTLANYAFSNILGTVTAGVRFKNNLISLLAFGSSEYTINPVDWNVGSEEPVSWNTISEDIIRSYASSAEIPGLEVEFIYNNTNTEEYCMCLDAGLYGFDGHPDVDQRIVSFQNPIENAQALKDLGFNGDPADFTQLKNFFTLDPEYLKSKGVRGVRPYRYGPNWAFGGGFLSLNILATAVPEFKNWEARNSGKIRMSGTPNGEPYAFGNQWLEWGGRIGIPEIEYVPVNPVTLGGGDFVDMNFGYRGALQGSLIYRGRLPSDVLAYENSDYEFAFTGITYGNSPPGNGGNSKYFIALTNIRQDDAVTNEEAYGISGDLETLVFSQRFSESPQDKTIHIA